MYQFKDLCEFWVYLQSNIMIQKHHFPFFLSPVKAFYDPVLISQIKKYNFFYNLYVYYYYAIKSTWSSWRRLVIYCDTW